MTVLDVIKSSTEYLAKKDVESPRLQVELLLAQILALPRMSLYLNFEQVLTATQLAALRESVKRRGRREPLQHIIGSTSFCGLEIGVNCQVLIPRPETELLAEFGWQFLREHSPTAATGAPAQGTPHALDFGTGSGCLAIALAVKCPQVSITAVDISAAALAMARQNAARHGVQERIQFREGDGFAAISSAEKFDLIVANPPYIPTAEIPLLQPEVRDFDPVQALDGGADGLDFYRRLALNGHGFLRPKGCLALEIGDGQATAVASLFEASGWSVNGIKPDYTGRDRFIILAPPADR